VRKPCAAAALAALSALPFSAPGAEIFKCVDGVRTIYQDHPCPGSAKAATLAPPRGAAASAPAESEELQTRLRAQVDEMARQRRKREIAAEIARLEAGVEANRQAEEAELAALRDRRGFNYHNLAAASWQREAVLKGIDAQMQATSDKYRSLRDGALERIAQLRKDLSALDKAR
jgi:hypothetical protein